MAPRHKNRVFNRDSARKRNEKNRMRVLIVLLIFQLQAVHREFWVHPINHERHLKGEYFVLYPDLRKWPEKFYRWFRMEIEEFDEILRMIEPKLRKQQNNYRESMGPEEMLAITLT